MKRLLLLSLIMIMTFSIVACAPGPSESASPAVSDAYQKIKPEDVKKMMDDGDDVIIVDVRTAEEYNSGHLVGAVNIPVETITDKKPAELPDRDAMIIIYCRTGNRTVTAYKKLTELGYTNVHDMGGIVDWPYETVTETAAASEATPAAVDKASDGVLSSFTSTDINGNSVDASIFNDKKLTLVNVWATFCSPCLQEMPDLGELNRQYADRGFQIVGIVTDVTDRSGTPIPDMIELVGEIVRKTDADYLHILPSEDLHDLLGQMEYVPTTIFVDDSGRQVGEMYVGSRSGDEWAQIIETLLNEVG